MFVAWQEHGRLALSILSFISCSPNDLIYTPFFWGGGGVVGWQPYRKATKVRHGQCKILLNKRVPKVFLIIL